MKKAIPPAHIPASYVPTAMQRATAEWLPNDKMYYAAIPGFQGVYGTGPTEAAARADLESSLVEWATLRLSRAEPTEGAL